MKIDYKIAGHRIRIEGSEAWVSVVSELDGFQPFEVEPEGDPTAYFMVSVEKEPIFTDTQYESGVDGITDVFGRYKGGYLFVMTPPEGDILSLWKRENGLTFLYLKEKLQKKQTNVPLDGWI